MNKWDKAFLWILSLSVIAVIAATAYKFLFLKDYSFAVEAPCDPSTDLCFVRDCSIQDECPPNELSNYKMFYVSAAEFNQCSDNSCLNECSSSKIACEEIKCGDTEGDICSAI